MSALETVCVLIAAKNAKATIARAVQSALMQRETREVVVIDDGSTDATANAAQAADDGSGRLTIISLAENGGPAAARNRGIAASTSDLICVLDSDDFLHPGRFGMMLERGGEDWDLLGDNVLACLEGQEEGPYELLLSDDLTAPLVLDLEAFVRGNISDPDRPRRELGFLKPLMRRRFLEREALRYDDAMRLGEDYALYAEALAKGARFKVVAACGYVAVERPTSLSGDHRTTDLQALVDADDRLLMFKRLPKGARKAIRSHRASIRRNVNFRLLLEAKRQRLWFLTMRHLLKTPATPFYIITETLRARARRASEAT